MSEKRKPIEAMMSVTKSLATPSLFNSESIDPKNDFLEPLDFSDLELKTLEDDPAFLELLSSFKDELECNRKSSKRTFIVALLSLVVGCFSLAWAIFVFLQ